LFSQPVQELSKVKLPPKRIPRQTVSQSMDTSSLLEEKIATLSLELQLAWPNGQQPEEIAVVLSNSKGEAFRFGLAGDQFFTDRREAGKAGFEARFAQSRHTAARWRDANELNIEALIDIASVELFADDGGIVMTDIFFPTEDFTELRLEVKGGSLEVRGGTIAPIQPIW
ncbi:MAG TPA: GH32 C-terminal domain-containing protein, partial [Phaeodactylibacter sp.]|nr:GH32 C-terminal domain-containing protein [Phaeodactylibacter sp.]